jgi:uncharacterized FlgJ-related protein
MKLIENIKKFINKYKNTLRPASSVLVAVAIFVAILYTIISFGTTPLNTEYNPLYVQTCMHTLKYNATKLELVNEVDNYIKNVATQSSLDGYVIVEECMNSGIDICFVLAQGENESHFGTTGLARKTNSVFNVYAFDGQSHEQISEKGKYKHPNYSVAPYIELLKNDYLVGGKTEYDLMDGEYVNKNGSRYASSETYEKALLAKYTKIRQNTKIDSLSQETNKYKLFLGL